MGFIAITVEGLDMSYDKIIQQQHNKRLEKTTKKAEKKYGVTSTKEILDKERKENPKDYGPRNKDLI